MSIRFATGAGVTVAVGGREVAVSVGVEVSVKVAVRLGRSVGEGVAPGMAPWQADRNNAARKMMQNSRVRIRFITILLQYTLTA
jgi:hypothetical protein